MPQFYLRVGLLILGFGLVLGLLFFFSGLNRGLGPARAARQPARPPPSPDQVLSVRGLVLVMGVSLIGGIAFGRPLLLLLGAVCLGLAYWRSRG